MLKTFLQGKPFAHPLHPALVHFPIGLFILSLILELGSYFADFSTSLIRASYYAMAVALVAALLAAFAGFADWSDIRSDHPAKGMATTHMILNLTATGLFGINLLLRTGQPEATTPTALNLLLSLVGVGIFLVSGYLGGKMVYDDGVGVGRHRRETRAPRKTIDVSMFERQDGWVVVCNADEVKDGESLRVDWGGTIITVVKQGGEVYAFQEFCTHRYGPLSEGKRYDHQIECPWHRSCFDIRNGKVIEGPAKVDLKTYSAAIRAGKILIG